MTKPLPTLRQLISRLQDLQIVDEGTIPAHIHLGSDTSRVLILAGSNGTGKSLLVSILDAFQREHNIEPITVSMKRRTEGGLASAFMFGDENVHSTGVISVKTALSGIQTARSRDKPHILTFDEPDIGLSSEFCGAFGEVLGGFAREPGKHTCGFVVVSHSRPLLRRLLECCPEQPHFVNMDNTFGLQQWLDTPQERTMEELLALRDLAHKRLCALGSLG